MATTYLYRDATSATGVTAATISCWVKKVKNDAEQHVWFSGYTADYGQYSFRINFNADNTLRCMNDDAGVNFKLETNRVFVDTNAWYHICLALDTSESAADRGKLYINGVRETSFSTDTNMTGDQFFTGKSGYRQVIGRHEGGADAYFDGLMGQYYYIDGTAYQASTFGETDADTGEWQILTAPTVTMGTNGFLVLKNGNTITDQSSNSNNLTLGGGTLTDMQESASNIFATNNPLVKQQTTYAMQYCNTWCRTTDAAMFCASSTLGMTKGKYYAEVKCGTIEASSRGEIGISGDVGKMSRTNDYPGGATDSYSYASNGAKMEEGTETSYGDSWTTGDIIGIAYDADNNKLYFSKNGVWQNSGDPTSGSTGTGALSIEAPSNTVDGVFFFACGDHATGGSTTTEYNWNYGNGYFGTTAISSEGTNASGIGKFEYDVPAGYTALSTKGLNE